MFRRTAIKNMVLATGGLISIPSWMISCGISDKSTHHSSFSTAEQKLLAAVTDTIIPAGSSIGALSMGVDRYLQKLFDDCYEKSERDNVKDQLKALDAAGKKNYSASFPECTGPQREQLLIGLSDSPIAQEKAFFELIKKETINGFNTSQEVMEKYLGYKVAPGYFHGCVPVKEILNG